MTKKNWVIVLEWNIGEKVREFFNERDNCTDRRYELERNNWLQQRI